MKEMYIFLKGVVKMNKKETVIKFTVDENTAHNLEEVSDFTKKTKARIMRDLIPIISSKNFEDSIPNVALERLEKLSQECWEKLHTPGIAFEVETLSQNMPAFITQITTPPMVWVKYPTYKVSFLPKKNATTSVNIDDILKTIPNISYPYATPTFNGKWNFIKEITCLAIELEDNYSAKEEVVQRLTEHNYEYIVLPSYLIRNEPIEFLEDERYFKVIPSAEN